MSLILEIPVKEIADKPPKRLDEDVLEDLRKAIDKEMKKAKREHIRKQRKSEEDARNTILNT